MNKFIREYENSFDLTLMDAIINIAKSDVTQSDIKNKLLETVNSKVIDYLSFSKECYPGSYFFKNMSLLDSTELNKPQFDSEVREVDGDKLIRNFRILLYLGDAAEYEELYFPNQNVTVKAKSGSLLFYPTSFMFPYIRKLNKNLRVVELNYYYKKEIIINIIKNGLGSDAVY